LWRRTASAAIGVGTIVLLAGAWLLFGRHRTAVAGAGGIAQNRVAVLYITDASRDSSLRYLADGLTEPLIDRLSAIRALDVVSRNGVAPFRGRDVPRDSIARALAAGTLVEGEVEPVGPRARVTIRLVDGPSGADVGRRQSFELPVDAPLAIRDSLVNQATILLRERLGDEVQLREQHASTKNVAAWSLVQRAERLRKDADARPNEALGLSARADSMLADAERADPRWIDPIILRGQLLDRRARLTRSLPALEQGIGHANRAIALA